MKQFISIAASLLLAVAMVSAEEFDSELTEMEADPRLFFVNFTSSLIQVNSTLLAYGLLFLAVLGAGAVALYYLYLESQNGSSYDAYGSSNSNYNYNYARSSNDAFEFNHLNILQWISLLQERLICEVMKEPTYYGTAAQKFKNGFQYAKYLEVLSLPDDMRELLDEYMDANNRADQSKECSEFFDCPYSIKDSVKRNLSGNDL
ncbi:unnamed protein product [Lepeophtheirus salmonis]|uniref:(salmon louse) hypothetical protein n=1 Tax=Lepeophtheirus salmonis TaxID=72036 RepID=A0A7R8CJL8_LEPSM|nr:unnamed protein product [Lepeophtheirus salmonis]CAF2842694.1 unnamed protein product [Lepeophtheirus salmonis]